MRDRAKSEPTDTIENRYNRRACDTQRARRSRWLGGNAQRDRGAG